jgi:hypothetical protein
MEIISVGGIGRCIAIFIIDLVELNFFKVSVTEAKSNHLIKPSLTLFKDSDGEFDSSKGLAGSSKVTESSKDSAEPLSKSDNKSKDLDMSSISEEVKKSVVISILADEVTTNTKKMSECLSA